MGILIFVIILVAIIIFINNTDTKSRIKRIKEMYPEYKYCYWTDGHILIDKEGNIIVIHKTDADNKELHQKYMSKILFLLKFMKIIIGYIVKQGQ